MAHRWRVLVAAGGTALTVAAALVVQQPARAGTTSWKGAETFSPVSLAPVDSQGRRDPCGSTGAAPGQVLSATFAGSGIDNVGGRFDVTVEGCLDTAARRLFGMRAVDRYSAVDSLVIHPHDVTLAVDERTCVATNHAPVRFQVLGGQGRFHGASGSGHYDLVFLYPGCPAPPAPVHVWFDGTLNTGASAR